VVVGRWGGGRVVSWIPHGTQRLHLADLAVIARMKTSGIPNRLRHTGVWQVRVAMALYGSNVSAVADLSARVAWALSQSPSFHGPAPVTILTATFLPDATFPLSPPPPLAPAPSQPSPPPAAPPRPPLFLGRPDWVAPYPLVQNVTTTSATLYVQVSKQTPCTTTQRFDTHTLARGSPR
jgi:hypothetical protein